VKQAKETAVANALIVRKMTEEKLIELRRDGTALVKSPKFQTITISTAAGTVILGGVGGAFGTASGVVVGGAVGVVPAIFTFGLSIPTGAVIGSGVGLCTGTAGGAAVGAAAGGASGYGVYSYRVEINNGLITIKTKAKTNYDTALLKIEDAKKHVLAHKNNAMQKFNIQAIKDRASRAMLTAQKEAELRKGQIKAKISDPQFQKTSAAAAGGAVVGGTTGAGTGAVVGGTVGAAVGIPAAIFTFGLSIPVCAVIGGGVGLCTGGTVGTTVGAVGGAAGYKAYENRAEIEKNAKGRMLKLKEDAFKVTDSIIKGTTGGTVP